MTSLAFGIYLRATPPRVCQALADPALVPDWLSVVRFDLVAMGQVTQLTVNHRGLDPGGSLLKVITPGWPMILSSLKSLVETGEPLEFRLSA